MGPAIDGWKTTLGSLVLSPGHGLASRSRSASTMDSDGDWMHHQFTRMQLAFTVWSRGSWYGDLKYCEKKPLQLQLATRGRRIVRKGQVDALLWACVKST